MKKNLNLLTLLLLFAGILTFASCSKRSQDYTSVIPENSAMIFSFNVGEMTTKSDILNNPLITSLGFMQLQQILEEDLYQKIEATTKDLNELGLDLYAPIYFAFTCDENGECDALSTVVIKVDNETKLQESIDLIIESTDPSITITESDGLKFISLSSDVTCAYNSSAFVICCNDEVAISQQEYLTGLFAQEKLITDRKVFTKFFDKAGDFKVIITDEGLAEDDEEITKILYSALPEFNPETDELAIMAALGFYDGTVNLDIELLSDNQKIIETAQQNNCIQQIKGTFLSNIPSDAIATLNIGLNGTQIAEQLKDNMDMLTPLGSTAKSVASQATRFLPDFTGDITVALLNVDFNIPYFVAMVELSDTKAMASLINTLPYLLGDNIKKLSSQDFALNGALANYALGTAIYFGYTDNSIYVSNDERYRANPNYLPEVPLADSPIAAQITSDKLSLNLNTENLLNSDLGAQQYLGMYQPLISIFDNVEVTIPSLCELNVKFKLVDETENALRQIASTVVQLIM